MITGITASPQFSYTGPGLSHLLSSRASGIPRLHASRKLVKVKKHECVLFTDERTALTNMK
ncbi:MAG: hypothetical protein QXY82_06125 [Desulfurococcaceae archaeon]